MHAFHRSSERHTDEHTDKHHRVKHLRARAVIGNTMIDDVTLSLIVVKRQIYTEV